MPRACDKIGRVPARPGMGFHLLSLASLLACLFVIGMSASARLPTQTHVYWFREGPCVIAIDCPDEMYNTDVLNQGPRQAWDWLVNDSAGNAAVAAGFRWASGTYHGSSYTLVAAPYLGLIVPTAILPILWLIRRVRTARFTTTGRCARCGYDLRGTPGRCPECGTVPTARA